MAKEIPAEKAKQGRQGTRVLAILVGGLVLLLVAWAVVEYVVR